MDLVLLIESGLLTGPRRLFERLVSVYEDRDQVSPPPVLPDPPKGWRAEYAAMAKELDLEAGQTDSAYDLVARWHAAAMSEGEGR